MLMAIKNQEIILKIIHKSSSDWNAVLLNNIQKKRENLIINVVSEGAPILHKTCYCCPIMNINLNIIHNNTEWICIIFFSTFSYLAQMYNIHLLMLRHLLTSYKKLIFPSCFILFYGRKDSHIVYNFNQLQTWWHCKDLVCL